MSVFKRKKKEHPPIEIIPMVDVMLLLLVFYILSSLAMDRQLGLPVQLPEASSGSRETISKKDLVITIDPKKYFAINKEKVAKKDLPAKLHQTVKEWPAGIKDLQTRGVIIRADLNVAYKEVVWVMDLLRQERIQNFAFAVDEVKQ